MLPKSPLDSSPLERGTRRAHGCHEEKEEEEEGKTKMKGKEREWRERERERELCL